MNLAGRTQLELAGRLSDFVAKETNSRHAIHEIELERRRGREGGGHPKEQRQENELYVVDRSNAS